LFIHNDLYQILQFHLEQILQQFSGKINANIKCFINQNALGRPAKIAGLLFKKTAQILRD